MLGLEFLCIHNASFELIMRLRLASSPFVFVLSCFPFFPSSCIMFTVELSLLGDRDKKRYLKKNWEEEEHE